MTDLRDSVKPGGSIIFIAFILANLRGAVFWSALNQYLGFFSLPWIEIIIWSGLFVLAIRRLKQENLLSIYYSLWKQNWLLLVFISFAFLSLFWTISFPSTLYRNFTLLFSSLIGAYMGTRYSLKEFLDFLFRFGALLLILCFTLAVFLPPMGAMLWEPYNGAWRGIFWHKNQFGPLAGFFGLAFLILALNEFGKKTGRLSLYLSLYAFAIINVFYSNSVAGYLIVMLMTITVVVVFCWLKIRSSLKPFHYSVILGLGLLSVIFILINLEMVLGLFNRDTSLTGRLPLWRYLVQDVISNRPWYGYGFGAYWSLPSLQIEAQQSLDWLFPVVISDNGFIDILLHLGIIGLILFLGVLVYATLQMSAYAIRQRTIVDFLPVLTLVFTFAANLTFSFFMETETFIWMILVALLFSVSKANLTG